MHKKNSVFYQFALNRINVYEKWIAFSIEKLDKLLVTDSTLKR